MCSVHSVFSEFWDCLVLVCFCFCLLLCVSIHQKVNNPISFPKYFHHPTSVVSLLSTCHPHFHPKAHNFLSKHFTAQQVSQSENPIISHLVTHPFIHLVSLGGLECSRCHTKRELHTKQQEKPRDGESVRPLVLNSGTTLER